MFEYIEVAIYIVLIGTVLVYLDMSFNQRK
jgi:hypothetical protein